MRKIKKILTNQTGMAMPMVIVIVTAAVSTIAYLIVTLIPQLQDEQKKSQDAIDYKIFITSLNDYVVHAMREKWCVNKISYNDNILETDLLLSNDCSSTTSMENMVTFEGNLERILWNDNTIGQLNDPAGANTIIGLYKQKMGPSAPPLTPAQVKLSEMKLRLSESVLNNMNDQHPLFVITRNIRKCVEQVDINIKRDPNSTGDEVKISINIEATLSNTKVSCLQSIRNVSSTAFYTFFPRRLHTYSLIKYKDLEADKFHEYHGPVYVAGDLILPPEDFDKTRSSIFYNTLTLGVYNEGVSGGEYEAGKIKTNDGDNYTFEERGHPYLSKQDSYPNFRGLIGGLRLDASEDKGISRIFTYGTASSSDVETLEACIAENQVKTKPSYTAGTILGYKDPVTTSGASINLRLGLTKNNRFKPTINAPQVINASPDGLNKKFILNVTSTNGTKEIGEFKVNINSDNSFTFTTAPNSPTDLIIDTEKYGLTNTILDPAITILSGVITKDNFDSYLPAGHLLYNLPEAIDFNNKALAFKTLCTAVPVSTSSQCDDFLVDNTCSTACVVDLTAEKNAMNSAKSALLSKVNQAKMAVATPAKIHFEVNTFQKSGKDVINQKDISLNFSSNWPAVVDLIKSTLPNELTIEFKPYHFSYDDIKIIFHHNLSAPNTVTLLKRQDNGNEVNFHTSGWRNSYNNTNIPFPDEPKELTELDCPDGMSLADWNQDMSESTNFSWNYANTPPGAEIEEAEHANLDKISFLQTTNPDEGHAKSHTKSVVDNCIVPNNREFVFGFYACKRLEIMPGRSKPLYMIGTFIVEELINTNTSQPVYWHSVWDAKAGGLIISEYFKSKPVCQTLIGKTWSQIIASPSLKDEVKKCSAMDLVTNGPNNFTWTTVDPDIGLIAGNTMTSQKVLRFQRWIIREDSRADFIR